MPTTRAVLALLVSASLAMPAGAQVRAAASVAGSAAPRVALQVPLSAPSALVSAPVSPLSLAPSLAFSAPSVLSAPSAAAAPAAAALSPRAAAASVSSPAPEAALAASKTSPESPAAAVPALSAASALAQGNGPATSAAPAAPAAEAGRSRWESFWSGSKSRPESAVDAPVLSESVRTPALARAGRDASLAAVAAAAVPAAHHGLPAVLSHAAPFAGAGAVLVGAYFANRAIHALLSKFAEKKGLDRHQIAAIRLVSSVALYTAATAGALLVGGASSQTMATVFGAGGTILTLGLRDVLGNVIQGVNFLITRPFTIGQRVQIDEQVGTVSDATLTTILVKKDDGSEVKTRHATLAAKTVIVFGDYQPDKALHLAVPAKPKFQGVLGAVWKSLDRRFWLSAAAFAALLAAPGFVPLLASGWIATGVHFALAGSLAWLTRRVDLALTAAVDQLARDNGWRKETAVIARLAVSAAVWALGGGTVLRLVGVSWTALGASVGVTTLGIGLASNNFFGSVVQGGEVLFSKPFKVGDRVKVGAFDGLVEDMTLYHVVLKLGDGRHALVPYAVVRDASVVVTPGK